MAPAADAASTRPLSRFTYGSFFPTVGVADPYAGSGYSVITPSSVNLLIKQERCLSSGASSGSVDFGAACGNPATTLLTYTPSSSGAPASVELQSTTVQTGSGDLTTAYSYDQIGNRVSVDGPNAGPIDTTFYEFDAARRLTRTTYPTIDAVTSRLTVVYDAEGRTTSLGRSFGGTPMTTSTIYDPRGLATSTTGPDGVVTAYDADDLGRRTDSYVTVDGLERRSRNVYYNGRLASVRSVQLSGDKTLATFEYSPNGLKRSETDPNGNRTTYCYDGFDRLAETRYPANSASPSLAPSCDAIAIGSPLPLGVTRESFGYDAAGNMASFVRRDGRVLQYEYDARGQSTKMTLPDGNYVAYTYDLLGRRLSAASTVPGSPAVQWSYDQAGRLISATTGSRMLAYRYYNTRFNIDGTASQGGSATDIVWPDNFTVRYNADALGRTTTIQRVDSSPATLATYSYDELSRRTQIAYGNGVNRTVYGYDSQFRLSCFAQDLAGGGTPSCAAGSPAATGNDVIWKMTRNAAGQVRELQRDNDVYAWLNNVNGDIGYGGNGLNQYSNAGDAQLTWDMAGNLYQNRGTTYGFDAENRLTSVTGSRSATLSYDATGRLARVSASGTSTDMLYDGDDLVAEYDALGTLTRRTVHGPGVDEPIIVYEGGSRTWLQADPHGSIVAISDDAGNLTAADSYGTWGEPGLRHQGRFGYTGQVYLPELRLYYYKARIYSPYLGRFIQPDPIGTAGGPNLYEYADSDPVNLSDPSGLQASPAVYGPSLGPLFDTIVVTGRAVASQAARATPFAGFAATRLLPFTALFMSSSAGVDTLCPGPRCIFSMAGRRPTPPSPTNPMAGASQSTPGDPGQEPDGSVTSSTGRTEPRNVREKLAMEEAQSRPEAGDDLPIRGGLKDRRWPSSDGWVKKYQRINGVEIHYVRNRITGQTLDWKFID